MLAIRASFLSAAIVIQIISSSAQALAADTISMSYNSDWPPYSSGAGGRVDGILPALMNEILSARMGLKVRNVGYPWKRVQASVKAGDVDAMVTVPTDARLVYAHRSSGIVYRLNMVLAVTRDGRTMKALSPDPVPSALGAHQVCDILGNGWGKRFFATHGLKPVIASKVDSCLRMVAKGRVDATLQAEAVLRRAIPANQLDGQLAVIPKPLGAMTFTLLLSKKSALGEDFLRRFDTVLAKMKQDGSYDALITRLRSGR